MNYKIGIYIRVSTDEQIKVADGSLVNQKHRIVSFLKQKNEACKEWGELIEHLSMTVILQATQKDLLIKEC